MATLAGAMTDAMGHKAQGEVAAQCDSEAANMITLNLMHEIVTGKRTVEEAREVYAENMTGYTTGRPAPYAERLVPGAAGRDGGPGRGDGRDAHRQAGSGQGEGHAHGPRARADGPQDVTV